MFVVMSMLMKNSLFLFYLKLKVSKLKPMFYQQVYNTLKYPYRNVTNENIETKKIVVYDLFKTIKITLTSTPL